SLMILFFFVCISACKKDDDNTTSSATPGTNEVWIQNSAFNPSTITVAVNTTITWTNKDNTNHTVTSNTSAFNSGTMANGAVFTHQFTTADTFAYHCNFHSSMTAKVIVH